MLSLAKGANRFSTSPKPTYSLSNQSSTRQNKGWLGLLAAIANITNNFLSSQQQARKQTVKQDTLEENLDTKPKWSLLSF